MEQAPQRPLVVAIGGGSASGKSTFTKLVVEACPNLHISVLQLDHYYRDCSHMRQDEIAKYNFDHPDSIDFPLLYEHLDHLVARRTISRPTYDFVTHSRASEAVQLESRDIIILEGLLVCYGERLRKLADLMIYIDASDDVRVIRRIRRDQSERGRSFEGTCQQYLTSVKPMHDQFVNPTRHAADIVVNWNTRNERIVEAVAAILHERGKKK